MKGRVYVVRRRTTWTALRFALDQQASILDPYHVLSGHLDQLQDDRRGRELGEVVLGTLELPPEAVTGRRGAEFVGVIDDIAIAS